MDPTYSPTALLTDLGLGRYAAAAVSLVSFGGFLLVHLMPFVPQPSASSPAFLTFLWKVANSVTGGYGNAKPSATVPDPATPSQVPPAPDPAPLIPRRPQL